MHCRGMALGEILGLVIFGSDTENTFKVWGGNLEFHRGAQKSGIIKGWGMVCIDQDCEKEGWFLNEEVIQSIRSHLKESGKEVVWKSDNIAENADNGGGWDQLNWVGV